VNVAGGLTTYGPVSAVTVQALDREIAINLKTAVLVSQAAIEALTQTKGCIINVSSIAYFQPQAPMAVYSAAKAAVAGFTQSLALELQDRRVRVNAIAPAMVRTVDNVAAIGDGEAQYVEMQEITDGVMSLASSASSVTGQILPIAPAGAGPLPL
jgi:NAD(P)-dependent dehydrogenase (short-subunit alcohol dehydrogenase family)